MVRGVLGAGSAVVFSLGLHSQLASAQVERAEMGGKGQYVVSSDAALSFTRTSYSGQYVASGEASTRLQLRPSVDYFVLNRLSVGTFVGFTRFSDVAFETTTFEVGSRIGYLIGLSELLALWPKVGLSYAISSSNIKDPELRELGVSLGLPSGVLLDAYVPILLHIAPHFFLGLGPAIEQDLTGDVKRTELSAARFTLGGWF